MLEVVREIGASFSPEQYLFWTRIQGSLWTLADFVIVFYLIRIANLCRAYLNMRRHRYSFWLFGATVLPALLLPLAPNGLVFFRLELLVTVPHFILLIYICIVDFRPGARALSDALSP